ncbi:MAG: tetratricopeptide repeat protein, partial [Kangiellaceae bacterium]
SSAQTAQEKQSILNEIEHFLNKIDSIPIPETARFFADSALAMGFADKAYQYLLPYSDSDQITNHQELKKLALQFSNYSAALEHQRKIFEQHQDLVQLKSLLLQIENATDNEQKAISNSYQFIKNYSQNSENDIGRNKLLTSNEFIVTLIELALRNGDKKFAVEQLEKIMTLRLSESYLSRLIRASLANNHLDLANQIAQRKTQLYPNEKNIRQAHDIAIWVGDIFRALELTQKIVTNNPSEVNIRQAIKESIALGDYSAQSLYYKMLNKKQFLQPTEYDDYIQIVELTDGSRAAIHVIEDLIENTQKNTLSESKLSSLLLHKARLHGYFSEYEDIREIWQQLKKLEDLTLIKELSSQQANLFAEAEINLRHPEIALSILASRKDLEQQEISHLQKVFSLAWNTGDKDLAIQILELLNQRPDYDSSTALNSYRYVQLHQPFVESDIPSLMELSNRWKNDRLLLIAIDLAYKNKNYQLLDKTLASLMLNSEYLEDERLIYYAGLSAIKQGKKAKVKQLFSQLIDGEPKDESIINSYLWWLIDENEIKLLSDLYNRYKLELKDKMDFWLVFSAASQKLNNYAEAEHWLKKLLIEKHDVSVNAILDYAQLMEAKGEKETAYRLRQYVVNNLTKELYELEPEHYSFYSMVKIFAGERFALPLLEKQVITNPEQRGMIDLFSYYLQRQEYQRLLLLKDDPAFRHIKLPDWQKLSIALLEKNYSEVEHLVRTSLQLPTAQKNYAMQKLGGYAYSDWTNAWQHGEAALGKNNDKRASNELRQVHINQHPNKSSGYSTEYAEYAHWNIKRLSTKYYQPIESGWWDLALLQQQADAPELISDNRIRDEYRGVFDLNLRIDWFDHYAEQTRPELLNLKIDLAESLDTIRAGVSAGITMNLNDRLQANYRIGIDQAFEVSQFSTIAAENDQISLGLNYFPTSRESISFRLNLNNVSTRLGDKLGTGWDYSIRASERLFSSDPGWEVYLDFVQQEYQLEDAQLTKINDFFNPVNSIEAVDFIDDKFARFSLGQRLFHGVPGQAGSIKPSPTYWLDTSVGINTLNNQTDFSISSGLGWRIFGDDELSIKIDWQSSDINGDESLLFSLGYYYNL